MRVEDILLVVRKRWSKIGSFVLSYVLLLRAATKFLADIVGTYYERKQKGFLSLHDMYD